MRRDETTASGDKAEEVKALPAAGDLDGLRDAVTDASNVSTGLWLSYLFTLFYFAIATGSVTHSQLLFEQPVKLPFLNVDLPLLGFFILAPMIFLVVHAYVLLHITILTGKVGALDVQLQEHFKQTPSVAEARRLQLPNNIFVQFLAGPLDVRGGFMGRMLRLVAQISLIVAPVALLVLFQLQFLPFHLWKVTWWHRAAVVIDIVLLWTLWPSIARGSTRRLGWRDLRQRWVAIAAVATSVPILIIFGLATYPGERLDAMPSLLFMPWPRSISATPVCGPSESPANTGQAPNKARTSGFFASVMSGEWEWASLHTLIIAGDVDPTTLRPTSLWPNSNRLVLPAFDVVDRTKFDSEHKIETASSTTPLRGRHLENAVLCGADLRKVDLTGAWLQGALLYKARLQGAVLDDAKLQDAKLNSALLQGASLKRAMLQRSVFIGASLQAASLEDASAEDSKFGSLSDHANLQAASFARSHLERAHFEYSNLEGVTFDTAILQAAKLTLADLQGATFAGADLEGADLSNAMVWRVDVRQVQHLCRNMELEPCWGSDTAGHGTVSAAFCKSSGAFSGGSFENLKKLIADQVPKGQLQTNALKNIEKLNPQLPLDQEAEMKSAWQICLSGQKGLSK